MFAFIFQMLFINEQNPWNIQSIYDLQHFNCPICSYKNNQKQEFINHAYEFHPESENYLKNINDGSLDDVDIPYLKEEPEFDVNLSSELDIKIEDGYVESLDEKFDNDQDNLSARVIINSLELDTYYCDICNSYFCNQNALQLHKDTNHHNLQQNWNESYEDKTDECHKEYKCSNCGKSFDLRRNLNHHFNKFHAKRSYDCDLCDKLFSRSFYLKRHQNRTHLNEYMKNPIIRNQRFLLYLIL